MLELWLIASLFFILTAVIVSYLLKAAIKKNGVTESSMENTTLIAIGLPPISSVKAKFLLPGTTLPGIERLGVMGKIYLIVIRGAFLLAVLSVVIGLLFGLWANA